MTTIYCITPLGPRKLSMFYLMRSSRRARTTGAAASGTPGDQQGGRRRVFFTESPSGEEDGIGERPHEDFRLYILRVQDLGSVCARSEKPVRLGAKPTDLEAIKIGLVQSYQRLCNSHMACCSGVIYFESSHANLAKWT